MLVRWLQSIHPSVQTVQRTVVAGLDDFGPIGTKHAAKTTGQRWVGVDNVMGTVGVFQGEKEVQGVEKMGFGVDGLPPDACPGVFDQRHVGCFR